jgi:hypothetical protein
MKRFIFIAFIFIPMFINAQISAGPLLGVNLSHTDNFPVNKNMLHPGIYAGVTGSYQLNKWLSFGIEVAWSEKSITYYNSEIYSSFGKLQPVFDQIFPGFPNISEIFQILTGTTGLTINDSVFETRDGITTFRSVEIPATAEFRFRKYGFIAGGYCSFLTGAETTEQLQQDIPLFDVFPPSTFDQVIPFISGIINSTFPAMNNPVVSTTTAMRNFQTFDYGLIGGFTYHPDDYLTFGLQYVHGLSTKLTPALPDSRSHSVIRFSVSYNIFRKVTQKPLF